MKILSLTNTTLDPALGSGKTVLAWSQGLRSIGNEVDVLPPEDFYRPWPRDQAKRLKMRIDAKRLAAKILAGGYDLIEFYGAEFGLLINKLARISRESRPLLVAHTNGLELLASGFTSPAHDVSKKSILQSIGAKVLQPMLASADTMAFTRVDAFAAICEADRSFVVNQGILNSERCAVVEPGIDEAFLSAPWQRPKKQWLVSFGSWTARKDPETLVSVVTRLLYMIPDLEFHVLGASGSKQDIQSAFSETLLPRIVVYPRLSQHDIVEVLTEAKVFLFPSLYEGFGMATTEAMACGCAVVLTPTGFGDAIRDGIDGFICNYRDIEMMTSRCWALFSDDELRVRCVEAARDRVSSFRWAAQVAKLEIQYKSWIETF